MSATVLPQNIEAGANGHRLCTYRVGGTVDYLALPTTTQQVLEQLTWAKQQHLPITVLGSGSNTIVSSSGIKGLCLVCRGLTETTQLNATRFKLGAGLSMAKAAKLMQQHQLTGAEFMIGVPGTIGGAIAMNAGAMGQETSSMIISIEVLNLDTLHVATWTKEQLGFNYRTSTINPYHHVVLSATVELKSGNTETIEQLMKESLNFRQTHHPKEPNGGSVFKNPNKENPAGKLLDQLGAKQWQVGQAAVSPQHANFIINLGHATSSDVIALMAKMKHAVEDHYGYKLHPENRLVGTLSDTEKTDWQYLQQD